MQSVKQWDKTAHEVWEQTISTNAWQNPKVKPQYKQIEQVWGGFDQRLFWIEIEEEVIFAESFI